MLKEINYFPSKIFNCNNNFQGNIAASTQVIGLQFWLLLLHWLIVDLKPLYNKSVGIFHAGF